MQYNRVLYASCCFRNGRIQPIFLFYLETLGGYWQQITKIGGIGGIFDILMIKPFYSEETGQQSILHNKDINCTNRGNRV